MMASLFLVVLLSTIVTISMGMAINDTSEDLSEDEREAASKALYEGELALTLSLKANLGIEITHHKKKRAAINNLARRWPKGIIPYAVDRYDIVGVHSEFHTKLTGISMDLFIVFKTRVEVEVKQADFFISCQKSIQEEEKLHEVFVKVIQYQRGHGFYRLFYHSIQAINQKTRQLITDATAHITRMTSGCIKFVPRTNEQHYVNIYYGRDGCHSIVGFSRKGAQPLSLGHGCDFFGTVVHELMHAVGFDHEHQRPDRDQYLYVNFANVRSDSTDQFEVIGDGRIYKGFNFNSIMMYGPRAFSKNKQPTMVAKDGRSFNDPFDKKTMQTSDAEQIVKFYNDQCNTNFNG